MISYGKRLYDAATFEAIIQQLCNKKRNREFYVENGNIKPQYMIFSMQSECYIQYIVIFLVVIASYLHVLMVIRCIGNINGILIRSSCIIKIGLSNFKIYMFKNYSFSYGWNNHNKCCKAKYQGSQLCWCSIPQNTRYNNSIFHFCPKFFSFICSFQIFLPCKSRTQTLLIQEQN